MERHEHPEVSEIENTIGEQAVPGPHGATDDGTQATQNRAHPLPADDGMKHLRQRILNIQSSSITHDQKRYLMQQLLTESYANAKRAKTVAQGKVEIRPRQNGYLEDSETPSASTSREIGFGVTALETIKSWTGLDGKAAIYASEEDRLPTYVPTSATVVVDDEEDPDDVDTAEGAALVLGCNHYRRNVKMQCVTCEKWYTCRLCHDEVEEHTLPRRLTKHMLCMLCGHPQKVSDTCVNCNESAARYYCSICKLWSDDVHKPIYHCDECGICRVGHGLDKDFFHCKVGTGLLRFDYGG
jgi:tyrosyl-DNA phosphodiesterase 2